MHQTDSTAQAIAIVRKSFLILGFVLFLVLSITVARLTGGHDISQASNTVQPELRAFSELSH